MSPELERQLIEKYPKMFRENAGIECGDGWYDIIDYLCAGIKVHTDFWNLNRATRPVIEQVVVDQIKEKFGTMRFYYSGGDEYISGLASMAEAVTAITCEVCGERGSVRPTRWVKTLCDVHAAERNGGNSN